MRMEVFWSLIQVVCLFFLYVHILLIHFFVLVTEDATFNSYLEGLSIEDLVRLNGQHSR